MPVENNTIEYAATNESNSATEARGSLCQEAFFASILRRSLPEGAAKAPGINSQAAAEKSNGSAEAPQQIYMDTAKGWIIVHPETDNRQQSPEGKNNKPESPDSFENQEKIRHEEFERKLHEEAESSRLKLNPHDRQILDELITAMKAKDERAIQSGLVELEKNYSSVKDVADALGKNLKLDDRLAGVEMKFVDGPVGRPELSMTWSRTNGSRDGLFSMSAGATSLTIRSDGQETASRSSVWNKPATPISSSVALDYLSGGKLD